MLVSMIYLISKARPTNDSHYSWHINAVEHVYPIIWGPYHDTSFQSLVINSFSMDTQTHIPTSQTKAI